MINKIFYIGVVEARNDPLKIGRYKVRVVGVHSHDKTLLPTDDLPWSMPLNRGSSMNGIGESSPELVEGSTVLVIFADEYQQSIIILGSLSGIPQTVSKLIDNDDSLEINFDQNVDDTLSVAPVSESPEVIDPTIIPKENSSNPGYAALIKAMDDEGITSKYARASILGICDVESGFKTKAENLNYSANGLLSTFPSVFKNDINLAKSVERKPQNIAEMVYGPIYGKGKELGNDVVGDGWKYRGRGYVQLTGKSNYRKYSGLIGADILGNPDLLLDETYSAKVTVKYFRDRVKENENSPSYIYAAIKAVGLNRADIREKKINAYNYYLGEGGSLAQTDKSTDTSDTMNQYDMVTETGIPVDKIDSATLGFSDPNFKYPLKKYINEPDVNRLARGRFSGTIVENKDRNRVKGIPTATGSTWDQPISPYNAKYPYNKVKETESGHIQEFDDTPGNERIHTYHRKGTFEEIDTNGTKTTRIVGDNYEIIDRNGNIYIGGQVNITVVGDINLLTQSDANVRVNGDANFNIHGNANLDIAGNYSVNVGGTYKVKASSIVEESSSIDVRSSTYRETTSNRNIISQSNKETFNGTSEYRWNGDKKQHIGADTYNRHDEGIDYSCPFDPPRSSDVDCGNISSAGSASATGLGQSISRRNKSNIKYTPLRTPIRNADEVFVFETPDELTDETPVIENAMPNIKPKAETVNNVAKTSDSVSCDVIFGMDNFSSSMILHTDSTGYSWTLGKLLNGNTLKEITVKGKNYSKQEIVCNLKTLAVNVLGKLNETIGSVDKSWTITSCYRNYIPPGGSNTSQHLIGAAVDISIGGNYNYQTTYDWTKIIAQTYNFDQLILEYLDRNGSRINWLHISILPDNSNRKSIMTFLNHSKYSNGLSKLA